MSVEDRDLGWQKLVRTLGQLDRSYVKVGVVEGTTRDDPTGRSDMAAVAAANEFGVMGSDGDWKIPPRPALGNAYDAHKTELYAEIDHQKSAILAGHQTVRGALDRIGLRHTAQQQASIRSNTPPPNSPVTVALKGSSRTLVDSGQYAQSIRHVSVVEGG